MILEVGCGKGNTMIKDLFLIRHAESSHPSGVKDFDRPLNDKGYMEAERMSDKLAHYTLQPELLISSPAKRALSTATIFAERLHIPAHQIQPENMIYEANVSMLLSIINYLPEQYDQVALFGHNPGITEFAGYLNNTYIGNIPTAGIIHIRFTTEWKMISAGSGEIKWDAST